MKTYRLIKCLTMIIFFHTGFMAQAETETTQQDLSLKAGSARIVFSAGPAAALQPGYATMDIQSGRSPLVTAVMSYIRDGEVISEVGIPASAPTVSARLFVDFRTDIPSGSGTIDINTGIAMVNMGSRTAHINLLLRNLQGDSTPIASGALQLSAKGRLSKFINQLDPDFVLPASFPSTMGLGALEINSDQPISILALRVTINQRGEPLFSRAPIADLASPAEFAPLNFPQIANGGGYQTTLLLVNSSDMQESGTIYFTKEDGSPYKVRLNSDDEAISQFHYTIQARGALRILTDAAPSITTTGWVQLAPVEGPAPVGTEILGFVSNGILVTESSVPSAPSTTHARIYIDCSSNRETGLAVAALGNQGATIGLQAFQSDGTTRAGSGPAYIHLSANGHRAAFANELISELPSGFTGILDLKSSTPFAALTLRSLINRRNDFLITAFPVADYAGRAPSSIVFPQITAGGGYQTELILLNTGNDAKAILNSAGENGAPFKAGTIAGPFK
jgi:hypothetical protein